MRLQHATLGAVNANIMELSAWPDEQVAQTIRLMSQRCAEDSQNPIFQAWAAEICGDGDTASQIERAFWHAKQHICFVRDEEIARGLSVADSVAQNAVEVIIRPFDIATYIQQRVAIGDCDDFQNYLRCLLQARGIAAQYVTVAVNPLEPSQFSHVYLACYPDSVELPERIALDASHGEYPGWEASQVAHIFRQKEWSCGFCPAPLLLGGALAVAWMLRAA